MGWFDDDDESKSDSDDQEETGKDESEEQPSPDGEFDVCVCHGDDPVAHHKVWVEYQGLLLGGIEDGFTDEDGHVSFPIFPGWSVTIHAEDYDGRDIVEGPYETPDDGDGFTVDISD
jgi:hypothetical protein